MQIELTLQQQVEVGWLYRYHAEKFAACKELYDRWAERHKRRGWRSDARHARAYELKFKLHWRAMQALLPLVQGDVP